MEFQDTSTLNYHSCACVAKVSHTDYVAILSLFFSVWGLKQENTSPVVIPIVNPAVNLSRVVLTTIFLTVCNFLMENYKEPINVPVDVPIYLDYVCLF